MTLVYQTPYYENEVVAREAIWGSPNTIFIIILLSIVGIVLWIATYVYVRSHTFANDSGKTLWLVILIISGLAGLMFLASYIFNGLMAGFPT